MDGARNLPARMRFLLQSQQPMEADMGGWSEWSLFFGLMIAAGIGFLALYASVPLVLLGAAALAVYGSLGNAPSYRERRVRAAPPSPPSPAPGSDRLRR